MRSFHIMGIGFIVLMIIAGLTLTLGCFGGEGDDDDDDVDLPQDDDNTTFTDDDDDDNVDPSDLVVDCIEFYVECAGLTESQAYQYCQALSSIPQGCIFNAYAAWLSCLSNFVDCDDFAGSSNAIGMCTEEFNEAYSDC